MRVVCLVICFLNVVFAQQKECVVEEDDKNIVTFNEGYKPHWYQIYFGECIRSSLSPEITVYTLRITQSLRWTSLSEISNFPLLKEVFLDRTELMAMPSISNLPKLERLSLASNRLRTISSLDFSQTPAKEIILSRNIIDTIENGAFGNQVEIVFLTCNNISEISSTWFRNHASVRILKLGGNRITAIPDNMFQNFVNLEDLELRNNQIKTLGVGSIAGPTFMRSLHLGYNNISEIKAEVFGERINITNFDVEYNRLSFLHEGMMNKMTAKNILLWGNPWQCPCQRIIDAWIKKNNENFSQGLPRDEDPSCVTALSFKNMCVPFVDDDLYETFLMNFEISPFSFC